MVNRIDCLNEKAQYLSTDISKKFAPTPSWQVVLGDTLKALKRLNNRLRWKEYFNLQHCKNNDKVSTNINVMESTSTCNATSAASTCPLTDSDSDSDSVLSESTANFNYSAMEWRKILETDELLGEEVTGLGTKFKPDKSITAPKGTVELENFLADLAREILWKCVTLYNSRHSIYNQDELISERERLSRFIIELRKELKSNNTLMVPTDKTNGYVVMQTDKYKEEMFNAL